MTNSTLFLIPTVLGDQNPMQVLPIEVKNCIENIHFFAVENEKTARRFIKKIAPQISIESLHICRIDKDASIFELQQIINFLKAGNDVGIIAEAGVPGVADPGADLVALAHQEHIKVKPLVGPSSILLAMMASGLNGQNFAFNGYLPIDKNECKNQLLFLEKRAQQTGQSQLFMETPYRNNNLIARILQLLNPNTKLCIACDISLNTEEIKTQQISYWRNQKIDYHKRPCIFIIGI